MFKKNKAVWPSSNNLSMHLQTHVE